MYLLLLLIIIIIICGHYYSSLIHTLDVHIRPHLDWQYCLQPHMNSYDRAATAALRHAEVEHSSAYSGNTTTCNTIVSIAKVAAVLQDRQHAMQTTQDGQDTDDMPNLSARDVRLGELLDLVLIQRELNDIKGQNTGASKGASAGALWGEMKTHLEGLMDNSNDAHVWNQESEDSLEVIYRSLGLSLELLSLEACKHALFLTGGPEAHIQVRSSRSSATSCIPLRMIMSILYDHQSINTSPQIYRTSPSR